MARYAPILVAEDDESDVLLLRMAFKKAGLPNALVITRDGQEVVDYLGGEPPYGDREANPLPCLVLLDLKMPRMSGFDVLAWLAARPDLKGVPVIVLSSSPHEVDIEKAKRMGATEYVVKPNDFKDLTKLLQDVSARWSGRTSGNA